MSMQINNSQQMLQQIDAGAHFKLNSDNKLVTQSKFGHAMQKVRDAFRHNPLGRAHIEARNNALHDAMARLVANENVENPGAERLEEPAITPQQRNDMAVRVAVGRAIYKAGFSDNAAPVARNYLTAIMKELQRRAPDRIGPLPDQALAQAKLMQGKPALMKALDIKYEISPELSESRCAEHSATTVSFMNSKQGSLTETGLDPTFLKDAARGAIHSINGEPFLTPDIEAMPTEEKKAALEAKFATFMKDKPRAMTTLASILSCQNGLPMCMEADKLTGKLFAMPDSDELFSVGLTIDNPAGQRGVTMEISDTSIHIKSENTQIMVMKNLNDTPLIQAKYFIEGSIDLTQDMTGKSVPDFQIYNMTVTTSIPE